MHEALAGLHSTPTAQMLTPEQMFDELTIACNALTASGAGVFAGNKARQDRAPPTLDHSDHARRKDMRDMQRARRRRDHDAQRVRVLS